MALPSLKPFVHKFYFTDRISHDTMGFMEVDPAVRNYVRTWSQQGAARLVNKLTDEQGQKHYVRFPYFRLKRLLDDFLAKGKSEPRWVVMTGARGTGKTTILAQLHADILKQQFFPQNALYLVLDEARQVVGANLHQLLAAVEQEYGAFEMRKTPFVLLLDEVHTDSEWASAVKSLYERTKNIFVICTGSSAVSLMINPDVTRRAHIEKIVPMSLPEYRMLRERKTPTSQLKEKIEAALYSSSSARSCFNSLQTIQSEVEAFWKPLPHDYIRHYLLCGTLPFTVPLDNEQEIYQRIITTLQQIVLKDLPLFASFDAHTLDSALRVLLIVSGSDTISLQNISGAIGSISAPTVSKLLDAFVNAEVIVAVPPRVGSARGAVVRSPRYHFLSPSYRAALLAEVGLLNFEKHCGLLLQDAAMLYLHKIGRIKGLVRVSYDPSEGGPDFILGRDEKQIPLEIGWGEKTVRQAMSRVGTQEGDYGLVVSNNTLSIVNNIVHVPLRTFLLS